VDRLAALLDDLRDLAELDAGGPPLHLQPVAVAPLAEELIAARAAAARARDLRLGCRAEGEPRPAWADFDRSQPVYLASPLGRLEVEPAVLPGLHPEAAVYRRGGWLKLGGGVNQLIADAATDHGRGAAYYAQHVRLEN